MSNTHTGYLEPSKKPMVSEAEFVQTIFGNAPEGANLGFMNCGNRGEGGFYIDDGADKLVNFAFVQVDKELSLAPSWKLVNRDGRQTFGYLFDAPRIIPKRAASIGSDDISSIFEPLRQWHGDHPPVTEWHPERTYSLDEIHRALGEMPVTSNASDLTNVTLADFTDAIFGADQKNATIGFVGWNGWGYLHLQLDVTSDQPVTFAVTASEGALSLPPSWVIPTVGGSGFTPGYLLKEPTRADFDKSKLLFNTTPVPQWQGQFVPMLEWHPDRRYTFDELLKALPERVAA